MGDEDYNKDSDENLVEAEPIDETISEQEESQDEVIEEKTQEQPKKEIHKEKPKENKIEHVEEKKEKVSIKQTIINFYDSKYKQLMYVTLAIMIISMILIGLQIFKTGDFINKDISLTGGTTLTILNSQPIDINNLDIYLNSEFPDKGLSVRRLTQLGSDIGIIIDGTDFDSKEIIKSLESKIGKINEEDYTVNMMGSSLGQSFFKETLKAIYVSFLFMGLVVFLYFGEDWKTKTLSSILTIIAAMMIFAGSSNIIKDIIAYILGGALLFIYYKNSLPSFMMIMNVFADLVFTVAVVNLLGIKVSTAGIASFLMIIGYCVESNILITTKLIKTKGGVIIDKIMEAFNTGFVMTSTAIAAVTIALVMTQSSVIREIMAILLIGLFADIMYTWIQNVAFLRIYLDRTSGKNGL
jgi:preprotein translocase subunit SecF